MPSQGSLIAEIERRLRVSEQVIKFITVRMDEEEKRLAKVKALRDYEGEAQRAAASPPHGCTAEATAAETERREEACCGSSG